MQHGPRWRAAIACAAAIVALALTLTTPASAQFGGIKKKLKAAAATDAAASAAPSAPAESSGPAQAAPEPGPAGATGGTIVLDAEVIERLVAGLKAAEADRQAAEKEDTPYGRYRQAQLAYEAAQPKCEHGRRTFPDRMAGNEKMGKRYTELVNKMVEAQGRGDQRTAMAYNDSAMAMQDPACTVKQPEQPDDYYEVHRGVHDRAEQAAMKKSGYSRSDLSQVRERVEMVLRSDSPGGDLSASEKSAVAARAAELKKLLGIRDEPPAPPATARPDTAAKASAQPAAVVPAGSSEITACYAKNMQKHEKRLEALGKRAEAAQKASDMAALMAIADTIQQLQTAGCTGAR